MKKLYPMSLFILVTVVALLMPLVISAEDTVSYTTDQKDNILTVKDLLNTLTKKIKPSTSEVELYNLIMQYRQSKGLPIIPYSKSLSKVAKIHVRDLQVNPPSGKCNLHSWSENGPWSPGCYTPDHAMAKIMWDKPRELTAYKDTGFEIATMSSAQISASGALSSWQGSHLHNDVIINKGMWMDSEWKAIGIGLYQNYSVVWFGKNSDPETNE